MHRAIEHAWVAIIIVVIVMPLDLWSLGTVCCPVVRTSVVVSWHSMANIAASPMVRTSKAGRHSMAKIAARPLVRTSIAGGWHFIAEIAASRKSWLHVPVWAIAVEISSTVVVWAVSTKMNRMRRNGGWSRSYVHACSGHGHSHSLKSSNHPASSSLAGSHQERSLLVEPFSLLGLLGLHFSPWLWVLFIVLLCNSY